MQIQAETLDDLMYRVLEKLLKKPFNVKASRGDTSEIIGALLVLKNPRARLSRTETKGTPFSAMGELLWYLSKKNNLDFIEYYIKKYAEESDDKKTVYGGYGPRLFRSGKKHDQIKNVIDLLSKKTTTRRAAIQLFEAKDLVGEKKEIPCTCTLQFILRNDRLYMITYMRSNDAFLGLPHDVFAFTMLQEIIARSLNVDMGTYTHMVGSLHLYKKQKKNAEEYLEEGLQSTKKVMPSMPLGDPWPLLKKLLIVEKKARLGEYEQISDMNMKPYWSDLVILIQIYSLLRQKKRLAIKALRNELSNSIYDTYIDKKLAKP